MAFRHVGVGFLEDLLTSLRAIGEPTRLRLLALCAQGDVTVTELTQVLGQSQPRVSRHLKLMCEGNLLERFREGAWVFYRLARHGKGAATARAVLDLLPKDDAVLAVDHSRLLAIKQARAAAAQAYFRENAERWDELRALHLGDRKVEAALVEAVGTGRIGSLLDIGTGTGRMLQLFGPLAEEGIGLDQSREMLAVARSHLEADGLSHCTVRQGDMYRLPFPAPRFDLTIIHQVLHYADDPALVVHEAGRVLKPGARLAVVDLAPHAMEELRDQHNHRRLGFSDEEVGGWCEAAGLSGLTARRLPGGPLTVVIWIASRPAAMPANQTSATGALA
jgi:ArsR family transcriptional regulator